MSDSSSTDLSALVDVIIELCDRYVSLQEHCNFLSAQLRKLQNDSSDTNISSGGEKNE